MSVVTVLPLQEPLHVSETLSAPGASLDGQQLKIEAQTPGHDDTGAAASTPKDAATPLQGETCYAVKYIRAAFVSLQYHHHYSFHDCDAS